MNHFVKSWLTALSFILPPTELADGGLWKNIQWYFKSECFRILGYEGTYNFCINDWNKDNTSGDQNYWVLHLLWDTTSKILNTHWESYIQYDWVRGVVLDNWDWWFLEIPWFYSELTKEKNTKCNVHQEKIGTWSIMWETVTIWWKICN